MMRCLISWLLSLWPLSKITGIVRPARELNRSVRELNRNKIR